MAKITNDIEDMADVLSNQLKRKGVDREDLKQEGLVEILESCKEGESKEYYFIAMRHRMLKYLNQEKKRGMIMNTYGGDRKSKKYIKSPLQDHIEFVNLTYIDCHDKTKKRAKPNYDNVECESLNDIDQQTESYLNGRDFIG